MNEGSLAGNGWMPLRENEPGLQRAGCDGIADLHFFVRQSFSQFIQGGAASTLKERDYKDSTDVVVYPGVGITSKENASNPAPGDPAPCLSTDSRNYLVQKDKPPRKYIVRRLTPTECARLQGFPDWWTDGADGSDSAKYKLWGNGIALPCAVDVLGRIAKAILPNEEEIV